MNLHELSNIELRELFVKRHDVYIKTTSGANARFSKTSQYLIAKHNLSLVMNELERRRKL